MSVVESKYFYLTADKKKYIHYEVIKNVVPITTLFIHGNLSSNRWWYPMIQNAELSSNPKLKGSIILAEIRGCGRSSDVDSAEVISIPLLSDEFLKLVSVLELSDFNIVGHSTGGSIATVMLTKIPAKIRRAILVDPVGARGKKFETPIIKAFQRMRSEYNLVSEVMRTTISTPDVDPKFFKDVIVTDAIRASQVMGLKIAKAFGEFNIVETLDRIESPVLILHGDQDQILPLEESRELARLIPNARLDVLVGTGHCPNIQDPFGLWLRASAFLFD